MAGGQYAHPGSTEQLMAYWAHGEGAAKIGWGAAGDFDRCVMHLSKYVRPDEVKGLCSNLHVEATGARPGHAPGESAGHKHHRSDRMQYTRSYALEDISIRSGGDGRTVDAYAACFNTPAEVSDQDGHYEEIIDPSAFNRAIEHAQRAAGGWNIPVMFNHGMTMWSTPSERHSMPIGTPEEIRADSRGLFTRTRYHKTQLADEVLEAIREGSITAYSFQGQFRRSDPLIPRGGFRADSRGRLPTVRRTESTLREFGPTPFPVYQGAEVVGVRAEQAAFMLSNLAPGEFDRLAEMFRSGTPLHPSDDTVVDSPTSGTPSDDGPAADDPPSRHSTRSPKEELQARRAQFLIRHGGGNG